MSGVESPLSPTIIAVIASRISRARLEFGSDPLTYADALAFLAALFALNRPRNFMPRSRRELASVQNRGSLAPAAAAAAPPQCLNEERGHARAREHAYGGRSKECSCQSFTFREIIRQGGRPPLWSGRPLGGAGRGR